MAPCWIYKFVHNYMQDLKFLLQELKHFTWALISTYKDFVSVKHALCGKYSHVVIFISLFCWPEDNGCEILSMCHVLKYLIDSSEPLIDDKNLEAIQKIPTEDWQDMVKDLKGSVPFPSSPTKMSTSLIFVES